MKDELERAYRLAKFALAFSLICFVFVLCLFILKILN